MREHEDKLENVDYEIKTLQDTMENLQKENNELINKPDDLENRSRRKNLVIFGIPEAEFDTNTKMIKREDCDKTIRDFFQFVGAAADDVEKIEICHLDASTASAYPWPGGVTTSPTSENSSCRVRNLHRQGKGKKSLHWKAQINLHASLPVHMYPHI